MFNIVSYEIRVGKKQSFGVANAMSKMRKFNQSPTYCTITDDEWRKLIFDPQMAQKYLKVLYRRDHTTGKRGRVSEIRPPEVKKWIPSHRATPGQALWFMRTICPDHIIQETF